MQYFILCLALLALACSEAPTSEDSHIPRVGFAITTGSGDVVGKANVTVFADRFPESLLSLSIGGRPPDSLLPALAAWSFSNLPVDRDLRLVIACGGDSVVGSIRIPSMIDSVWCQDKFMRFMQTSNLAERVAPDSTVEIHWASEPSDTFGFQGNIWWNSYSSTSGSTYGSVDVDVDSSHTTLTLTGFDSISDYTVDFSVSRRGTPRPNNLRVPAFQSGSMFVYLDIRSPSYETYWIVGQTGTAKRIAAPPKARPSPAQSIQSERERLVRLGVLQ